jgi:structural maintenance of chromosome 2
VRGDIVKEESAVAALREQVDQLSARVSNLEVSYTAPSGKFDKSKVKGIVASLIKLKDKKTATALEVSPSLPPSLTCAHVRAHTDSFNLT